MDDSCTKLLLGRFRCAGAANSQPVPQLLPIRNCTDDGLETFHTYRHLVKEGTPALLQTLPQLTLEEYDLYRFLQENNFRLEQEQIPNEDSIKKIKQTVV